MNFLGNYFTYNNISSELYNLTFIKFNTTTYLGTGNNSTITDYRIKTSNRTVSVGFSYAENLSYDVEFISDTTITAEQHREILKWLSNSFTYNKLYLNTYEDIGVYLNCRFTNIEKIEGALDNEEYGIIGYKATIQCDAPWAWEDGIITTIHSEDLAFDGTTYTYIFNNQSDSNSYLYPVLELQLAKSTKHFQIKNTSDNDRLFKIDYSETDSGFIEGDTFTYNPENLTVTSSSGLSSTKLHEIFNKLFLRFEPGENILKISSGYFFALLERELPHPFSFKLKYRNARFL